MIKTILLEVEMPIPPSFLPVETDEDRDITAEEVWRELFKEAECAHILHRMDWITGKCVAVNEEAKQHAIKSHEEWESMIRNAKIKARFA